MNTLNMVKIQVRSRTTGCPTKMWFMLIFEFLTLGRMFFRKLSKYCGDKV